MYSDFQEMNVVLFLSLATFSLLEHLNNEDAHENLCLSTFLEYHQELVEKKNPIKISFMFHASRFYSPALRAQPAKDKHYTKILQINIFLSFTSIHPSLPRCVLHIATWFTSRWKFHEKFPSFHLPLSIRHDDVVEESKCAWKNFQIVFVPELNMTQNSLTKHRDVINSGAQEEKSKSGWYSWRNTRKGTSREIQCSKGYFPLHFLLRQRIFMFRPFSKRFNGALQPSEIHNESKILAIEDIRV